MSAAPQDVQPIWGRGDLWVFVLLDPAFARLDGLRVTFVDSVHPTDPGTLSAAGPAQDITSPQFTTGTAAPTLSFGPPVGKVGPVRYWTLMIFFVLTMKFIQHEGELHERAQPFG